MNCLSNIATHDLARDLVSDVVAMLTSNRPYTRKRALLLLYKLLLKYPDALRPSFPQIKARLEDDDLSVCSAAVNIVVELAQRNPKNFLALAPLLFKILTTTGNNWMLIKVVKLLSTLCTLEPRLAKKLADPLTNILNTSPAKSLQYEVISAVFKSIPQNEKVCHNAYPLIFTCFVLC